MTESLATWFIPVFFSGMTILAIGVVLMFAYRKPGTSFAQFLMAATADDPYPLGLRPRLKLIRDDRVQLVYAVLLIGIAIVLVDVLALAGIAIANSMGRTPA
ncbi:MAG: hypothetical protein WB812_00065 [Woeseiaceae bacterium]